MSQGKGKIKINKKVQPLLNNKLTKDNQITLTNSLHLIADDSDNESVSGDSVSWSDNESHNNEEESEEEVDEDDEIVDYEKVANEITNSEKTFNEINFEVVKDEKGEKNVKISVSLDLDESDDIITLEFSISRETFLKIAKELK